MLNPKNQRKADCRNCNSIKKSALALLTGAPDIVFSGVNINTFTIIAQICANGVK